MVRRPRARAIPMVLALGLLDRKVVDASKAGAHQAILGELPVLVAVRAKPVAGIVVPFIGEAHRDPALRERPELLDQPVVDLLGPFAREDRHDLFAAADKLGAVTPRAVRCIGQRHALRIAAVPAVFGAAHLLDGGLAREWRKRWTALGHDFSPLVAWWRIAPDVLGYTGAILSFRPRQLHFTSYGSTAFPLCTMMRATRRLTSRGHASLIVRDRILA